MVAIGTIVRGDTDHYEIVVRESTAGIARVSLDTGVPVTNAILAVNEFAHAWNVPRKVLPTRDSRRRRPPCGPPWRCGASMQAELATTGSDQPTGNLVGTIDGKSGSAASPTRPPPRSGSEASRGPITRPISLSGPGSRSWQQVFRLLPFSFADNQTSTGGNSINELRVNGAIRAKEVLVIAPDGAQIGVKKLNEALWLAEQLDLDLVEVAPNAKPPVCRLMDYGKYKYEQSVKAREARKKQTRTTIKELRMKVRIGSTTSTSPVARPRNSSRKGTRSRSRVRFRGREQERPAFGKELLDRLAEDLSDVAVTEQSAKLRRAEHDHGPCALPED